MLNAWYGPFYTLCILFFLYLYTYYDSSEYSGRRVWPRFQRFLGRFNRYRFHVHSVDQLRRSATATATFLIKGEDLAPHWVCWQRVIPLPLHYMVASPHHFDIPLWRDLLLWSGAVRAHAGHMVCAVDDIFDCEPPVVPVFRCDKKVMVGHIIRQQDWRAPYYRMTSGLVAPD